ncbi:hypothetical protein [Paraburkholderia xenovorans]|uniref:hypothetical protein n=1 Tax=Paraburkholderia xenovorans TaxID=36873 RepID=UPI0015C53C8D|nr:hypothetical protein [Paraburkholderia xenovorans]NPT36992.1 hypothetical protein [Paraburkholderia xenovorans]
MIARAAGRLHSRRYFFRHAAVSRSMRYARGARAARRIMRLLIVRFVIVRVLIVVNHAFCRTAAI